MLTSAALQCVVVSLPKYGHSYRHHRGILLPSPVIHIVIIVIIVILVFYPLDPPPVSRRGAPRGAAQPPLLGGGSNSAGTCGQGA